jgi:hypothetical protein
MQGMFGRMALIFGAVLALSSPNNAMANKSACVQLRKKVCQTFGFLSFACRVHERVARHPSASQKTCSERLSEQWTPWEAYLRKQEANMQRLEKMAENYGSAGEARVEAFRQKISDNILAQMIGMQSNAQADPNACRKLRKLVCADFGPKAFYCQVFTLATKANGVKAERCQDMRENWSTQKEAYGKQEKILFTLFLQARKDRSLQPKYAQTQKSELLRILAYLRK